MTRHTEVGSGSFVSRARPLSENADGGEMSVRLRVRSFPDEMPVSIEVGLL